MSDDSREEKNSLRERAEARLFQSPPMTENLSGAELKALIHDYQVHQIELEIQNEELRETQKQLEEARDRFARLFNDAPVGYLTVDEHGIIVQTNETFATMVGKEAHLLPTKALADFILAADRSVFHGRFRAFFKTPRGKELDFRLKCAKGTRNVRCVGRIEDESFKPSSRSESRILLVVSDITAQIRAETALRERERFLSAILETTQDGFWIIDGQGRITEANAAYCRMSGYSKEELTRLGVSDLEAVERFEETKARIGRIVQNRSERFETRHRRKDGSLFDVEVSVSHLDIDGGRFVCFCRDISARKRDEDRMAKIVKELEQAIVEKDAFFSIIAHDLKSPMSGFLSLTRSFADDVMGWSAAELKTISQALLKGAEGVTELLDNLLQWAMLRRGMIEYEPRSCDFRSMVARAMDAVRPMAALKSISLENRVPDHVQALIDQPMMDTILRNLLGNALKFTHREGTVSVMAERRGSMIHAAVQDNGVGLDTKELSRLFSLNQKTSRPGTEGEKSSGLGLILCRDFIARHGGRIWAESDPGRGATFHFTVPAGE
ncbi:MAG: PAS domain S-box protein [Deltaproteobacteria bacterium]|nr:PAS domain S-box protein [Deltaproteobacteria bacterium]